MYTSSNGLPVLSRNGMSMLRFVNPMIHFEELHYAASQRGRPRLETGTKFHKSTHSSHSEILEFNLSRC